MYRVNAVWGIGILTVATLVLGLTLAPQAEAVTWNAGRIIDDNVFVNNNSMSSSGIQSFLNNKSSACLKNYQTPSIEGGNEYGSNVSAATAIKQASNLFNINPQVILATLQKEQGLITRGDCPSWRYQSAMGFGCPDNDDGCDAAYKNFSKQLYQGARHFRGFYDQADGWFVPYTPGVRFIKYNPSSSCGGSDVNIRNRATASLYSYTPYQPNAATVAADQGETVHCGAYGNINFWRYFNQWFGSTLGTPFFRIGNNPEVYMLGAGNTYYYVPSLGILKSYGYGKLTTTVAVASSSYLSGLVSAGNLPPIAKFESAAVYLMDDGGRHHFSSWPMFADVYGYESEDVANLPEHYSYFFTAAPSVKSIVQERGGARIYLIEGGTKRHIADMDAYNSGEPKYSSLASMHLGKYYLSTIPNGSTVYAPGTLYRIGSTAAVYVVNDFDSSLKIPSRAIFDHFGFSASSVRRLSSGNVSGYMSGNLGHFVQAGNIWLVFQGRYRSHISESMAGSSKYDLVVSEIPYLRPEVIRRYTSRQDLRPDLIRAEGEAEVYLVENGTKRWITSQSVLSSHGGSKNVTNISGEFVGSLPEGANKQ